MEVRQTIVPLQYLRGVAAMMVVLHHAGQSMWGQDLERGRWNFGQMGVMIFFVISGFIMLHTARHNRPGAFALHRVIRVVPLYWLLTGAYFAILLRNDLLSTDPLRRLPSLVGSLFFVPGYHIGTPENIWPVLVQGWTLNFEMFFYALFAVGLAFGRPGAVAAGIVVVLVALGQVIPGDSALFLTWTSPLMLLFVAGLALAELRARRGMAGLVWLLPVAGLVTLACAFGGLGGAELAPAYLAAIGVVAGTIAWADRGRYPDLPLLARLGDASYSIYLSHTLFLIALMPLLRMLPLTGWLQFAVVTVLAVVLSSGLGVVVHDRLERPMTQALRRRFDRGRMARTA